MPPCRVCGSSIAPALFLLLLGGLLATSSLHPQPASAEGPVPTSSPSDSLALSPHPPSAWNQVSLWIGGTSLNGQLIGKVRRSTIGMLGLRYHRRLSPAPNSRRAGLTYTYMIDLLPVVALSIPSGTVPQSSLSDETTFTDGITTYGVGVAPLGLRINYRTEGRVEPFIAGSTGAMYFLRAFPDGRGRRLNFMVDAGGGLEVRLTPATTLSIGYRYHHLSNGFRGAINPGIDSHLFHVGFTVVP